MAYKIRMGIPEMEKLWNKLQSDYRRGNICQKDYDLYKKLGSALRKLSNDPMHPGLNSHEIPQLSKRYGMKVWESYLENKNSSARRIFWVYGPDKMEITIIGLEPHPEDKKNGAYARIKLSKINEMQ